MALIIGRPVPMNSGQGAGMQFSQDMPLDAAATQKQAAPQKRLTEDPRLKEIAQDISSLTRRFRILEERYINMRKRAQLMDQSMLVNNKKILGEIKASEEAIAEMGRKVADMKDKFSLMARELETCVKKADLEVVKRYINFWNPLNFVTQDEAEKIIRRVIESVKTGKEIPQYPVYEPENEEEAEEGKQQMKEESAETKTGETEKKTKWAKSKESEEEEAEKEDESEKAEEEAENEEGEKGTKGKSKVDLDDITGILHKHVPF